MRSRWDAPVTCVEVATAMYRAGQPRHEVKWRLARMGRWSTSAVHTALYEVECRLGLVHERHGNAKAVREWLEAAE